MSKSLAWLLVLESMLMTFEARAQERPLAPVVVGQLGVDGRPGPVVAGAREATLTERLLLRQQWVAYREHERREIKLAGPIVGLLLGCASLGPTSWLLAQDNTPARLAGGLLTGIIAAPLIGVSTAVLVKRAKKRRAIYREIWQAPPISATALFRF